MFLRLSVRQVLMQLRSGRSTLAMTHRRLWKTKTTNIKKRGYPDYWVFPLFRLFRLWDDYRLSTPATIGRLSDYRLLARFCFSAGCAVGTGRCAGPGGVLRLYFCGAVPVAVRFPLGVAGCVARELPQIAFLDVYRRCDGVFCIYPYQYHSISFRALCAVSSGNRRYTQTAIRIEIVHGAVAAVYRPQEQRKRIRCTSAVQTQKEPPHGADRAG